MPTLIIIILILLGFIICLLCKKNKTIIRNQFEIPIKDLKEVPDWLKSCDYLVINRKDVITHYNDWDNHDIKYITYTGKYDGDGDDDDDPY